MRAWVGGESTRVCVGGCVWAKERELKRNEDEGRPKFFAAGDLSSCIFIKCWLLTLLSACVCACVSVCVRERVWGGAEVN